MLALIHQNPNLLTMKKFILLIILAFLSSFYSHAQEFGFGVRGGISTFKIGDITTVGSNGPQGPIAGLNFEPTNDLGFQFGSYFL